MNTDFCVAVVALGRNYYLPVCLPHIEAYCQRYGYELIMLKGRPPADGTHPSWEKLRLLRALDRPVLFMDGDMVPTPQAPPIHEAIDTTAFNVASMEISAEDAARVTVRYPDLPASNRYYNCGLFYVPATHVREIAALYEDRNSGHWCWEQGCLNHYTRKADSPIRVHELDGRWNYGVPPNFTPDDMAAANILHFWSGHGQIARRRAVQQFVDYRRGLPTVRPLEDMVELSPDVYEQLLRHPQVVRLEEVLNEPRMGDCQLSETLGPVNRCVGLAQLAMELLVAADSIVEIGRFLGVSTETLALTLPRTTIYSVELQPRDEPARLSRYANVVKLDMPSLQAVDRFGDGSLAGFYMDGTHLEQPLTEELNAWVRKLRPGGIAAGHDYGWEGVEPAVNNFFKRPPDYRFVDSSWAYRVE